MFVTADQILIHAIGDYCAQSHWMATTKTNQWKAALCHVLAYGPLFLFLTRSPLALLVIVGSHYVIDRYRLARYVVFAKNRLSPRTSLVPMKALIDEDEIGGPDGQSYKWIAVNNWHSWKDCSQTGFHKDVPIWLSTWLLIIVDNIIHVCINAAALKWL